MERRFPPPWTVERIPGGFKVLDANGQSLAYVYSRGTKDAANIAGVLTEDEARRIASNIAKLPDLLSDGRWSLSRKGVPLLNFHAITYEVIGNVWLDCLS
jgi:hypothetical protein